MRSLAASRTVRLGERGATLLLALLMSVVFTLLALSLLSTTDMAVRVLGNGAELERAERAAAAGIEWAAATVLDSGLAASSTTLGLDNGLQVAVRVAPSSSPQVVAQGRCNGVEVTLAANLVLRDGSPLPYAFASFAGQQQFRDDVLIEGSAYLAQAATPISASSTKPLQMYGDLFLVSSTAPSSSLVDHKSGRNVLGVTASAVPVVDTTPYSTMASGSVPVTRYGAVTLKSVTLNGIVVVTLLVGQSLVLQDMTLNGTLVVTTALDADLLRPTINMKGTVVINGGTATTGNLAILAPYINLDCNSATGATVSGVALVKNCVNLRQLQVTGQLVTMGAITSTADVARVSRPVGFVPDVPIGVRWPGASTVRIRWLGLQ